MDAPSPVMCYRTKPAERMQIALAISMEQEGGEAGAGQRATHMVCAPDGAPKQPEGADDVTEGFGEGKAPSKATRRGAAKGDAGAQKGRKRRRAQLKLSAKQVDGIFDYVANGKVTIGVSDFIEVVNKLVLDIDDDMVAAAFELIEQSRFAGPCNRIDRQGLHGFVADLLS
jgi:hypothetical protein